MEPLQGRPRTFREAVCWSLANSPEGIDLLAHPQRFHSIVADNCEEASVELDIFEACHDSAFVRHFYEAAQRGFRTYGRDAIARGTSYLHEERHIDYSQARQLCHELALGIADYLGTPSEALGLPPVSQSPVYPRGASGNYMPVSSAPSMSITPEVVPGMLPSSQHRYDAPQNPAQQYGFDGAVGWTPNPVAAPAVPEEALAPPRRKTGRLVIGGAVLGLVLLAAIVLVVRALTAPAAIEQTGSEEAPIAETDSPSEQDEPEETGDTGGDSDDQYQAEPTQPVLFEVSFETGGGTRIEPEKVEMDEMVYSPEDPTRNGYVFAGWYKEDTFENEVTFPFTPTRDTVLYAKWDSASVLTGAVATLNAFGHTYALYDTSADWQSAEDACEELGGHLVTITSSGEQGAVEGLVSNGSRNTYWLGGYLAARDNWQWVTSESFDYTNWAEGLPDNWIVEGPDKDATEDERNDIDSSENALVMYRVDNPNAPHYAGNWNDLASNGECNGEDFFGLSNIGYICEWDEVVN